MLGLLIVLYGLEGLHLHAPVWMVQKGSHFREMCTSQRGGGVIFFGARTQSS